MASQIWFPCAAWEHTWEHAWEHYASDIKLVPMQRMGTRGTRGTRGMQRMGTRGIVAHGYQRSQHEK